ncbi:hypothetical protein BCR39DRAFT_92097 [Naematelia encephala]|uniref:WSC domain-containing protein n=1 Tax=Naematelia encephala TaxID=71784 RepID=A0A1Y2B9A2_9TREE|nr:hypothetical protein BCR39DRAFT_92097 [Naematelia encephala]
MRFSFLASVFLLATSSKTLASPMPEVGIETSSNHLEARATRSSQGWYSYGCYMDCYDGMDRFLPHQAYIDANNSPDMCVAACKDSGYNYAGLQFGKECYCGNTLAGPPTAPSQCDVQCADGHNHCGGPCRNNIWSAFEKPGH